MFTMWMLAVVVGCAPTGDEAEMGTLEVPWTVGPDGCAAAEITEVAVVLDDALMGSAPCEDGVVTLERIESGVRQMEVFGLDAAGVERYAADGSRVTVDPDETTVADEQVLTALPARLEVTWYFANGRLCATNDVVDIEVSVWDDGYLAAQEVAACDDGLALLSGVPSGAYLADVAALDADGVTRFVGSTELVVDKGDVAEVEVRLDEL